MVLYFNTKPGIKIIETQCASAGFGPGHASFTAHILLGPSFSSMLTLLNLGFKP